MFPELPDRGFVIVHGPVLVFIHAREKKNGI